MTNTQTENPSMKPEVVQATTAGLGAIVVWLANLTAANMNAWLQTFILAGTAVITGVTAYTTIRKLFRSKHHNHKHKKP